MSYEFYADAAQRSQRRNRRWYQQNLLKVLNAAKEKQVREIDASIALAEDLMRKLDERIEIPEPVKLRELTPSNDINLMKPIEPDVLDLLSGSTEKGAAERYLRARNKKSPEDKFYFRAKTSWDYGWQQKQSGTRTRDQQRGRCAILRDTFYRKNNLGPDPRHYAEPAGAVSSICSEYSCNF